MVKSTSDDGKNGLRVPPLVYLFDHCFERWSSIAYELQVPMMIKADGYRERVRSLIARRTGEPITNGSHDHAAILTEEAFNSARSEVRLLCTRLDPNCFGRTEVRNAARFFLADPDHKARILLEAAIWDEHNNFEWQNHPFLKDLQDFAIEREDCPARLELRLVPMGLIEKYRFNFLLLDDYGFRFEEDRDQPAAVAAFMPKDAPNAAIRNLGAIFDTLWSESKPLHLNSHCV